MNILGLVFSLLLILSYAFHACWDKQLASSRLRSTYVGHESAHRKILNSYQSEIYEQLRVKKNPLEQKEEEEEELASDTPKAARTKKVELNRECSKINIWPLVQEGRETHPLLYEITAKMIRTFYSPLKGKKKRFEYHFLDALLKAARVLDQKGEMALEKIDLEDEALQKIYYRMLKGTKQWDLAANVGYPPLLDYIKTDPSTNKICLFHAHTDLITALFNAKIAGKLHEEIHRQDGPLLTKELIEHICSEFHQISVDQELFELLELGRPVHEENRKAFIAQDRDVFLRKNIYIKGQI